MKKYFLILFLMIVSFLAGAVCMRLIDGARAGALAEDTASELDSASLVTIDLKDGQLPEGTYEAEQAADVQSAEKMPPSQIADVTLEGFQGIYVPEKETQDTNEMLSQMALPPQKAEPVVLATTSTAVNALPTARVPVEDSDDNSTLLVQLPVSVKIIKTQNEYKEFKRTARGKYPDVNFKKEMLVVLLSESNMPDNMLEIVKVTPSEGEIEVSYRVNIFGLDQKTNTHSVAATEKSNKNVVLKQVR